MAASQLPGAELVEQGLRDLEQGAVSEASLLVSIGAPRLRSLGVPVNNALVDAEMRLYEMLARRHGPAAHARFNALVRRLVSFERALACAS